MQFRKRTLIALANMICGNFNRVDSVFPYRSSSAITRFFEDCDTRYTHDGSTRNYWVAETLAKILEEPQPNANTSGDIRARHSQFDGSVRRAKRRA